LGGNPVLNAPVDLGFGEALGAVPRLIHLGLYQDETVQAGLGNAPAGGSAPGNSGARRADAEFWHLPRSHYLESWGDVRSWDGTVSVTQPLIAPLYDGKSPIEILALLAGEPADEGFEIVRTTLRASLDRGEFDASKATGGFLGDFESFWRSVLEQGVVPGSADRPANPAINPASLGQALNELDPKLPSFGRDNLEIVFTPDPAVYDGRFANNGWLQEIPRSLTKITWDNAALLSPATAEALGLRADDLVVLKHRGREIKLPVYVMPGQAPFSCTVHLGYGRTAAGRVGTRVGSDVYRLRESAAPHFDGGLTLAGTGRTYKLACTQEHHAIDAIGLKGMRERIGGLVREGTLAEYKSDPHFAQHEEHPPLVSMWKEHEYQGHRWGMTIDLNSCTGCNACVVACTAENNVPVVGKARILEGREMQWIRIDRYFVGDAESPEVAFEPVACVHCENAPCEQVCPVGATMHDSEGLNVMVYNRCIGTRYCSNNCPFKVRRFNFFNYRKNLSPSERMAFNPEVTVRSRGVMEKCTYCIQRIEAVKIRAKNERRPVGDGEIVPACAQTCPTQAIQFGDLNDPESKVAKLQAHPRSYAMLAELNIKPRTMHLARLRNPHEG